MSKTIDQHSLRQALGQILPAPSMRAFGRSQLRDLLARAARPGVLSFAVGMPADETFPTAEIAAAARATANRAPSLQYGLPCRRLKHQIVELMASRGVTCSPDEIFLTAGSQQGMDLLTRLLVEHGGRAMVEQTVYEGALLALEGRNAELVTLASSADRGLDVDDLERQLATGRPPAYLFLIPDGHNPLGIDLPAATRSRLVTVARRHRLPLIEDDAYGLLRYDGPASKPLRALDDRWVVYLGTFSKIVAPAMRVGWIVAPTTLQPALSALKHASDLDSATFGQRMLSRLLDTLDLDAHCTKIRQFYRQRRDALCDALDRHCADVARWHRPATGFYVWVELRPGINAHRLLEIALATEDLAFCPGPAFAASGSNTADSALRLSFARLSPDDIEEGVIRLRRAIERLMDERRVCVTQRVPASRSGR